MIGVDQSFIDLKAGTIKSGSTYSQKEIIQGCLDNKRKFQEVLYKQYFSECMFMCLRYTKDPEIAKLIVHDGFLKVFLNLEKFSGEGSLRSWIKRIVFNALSDHYRKESKYLKLFTFEEYDSVRENTVIDQLYYDDLLKLIDDLDYMAREVFILFTIEGYSHKEIGKQLNITEGNSKWHLHKAKNILKDKIREISKIKNHA